jgi:glycosyltransferase involved in cell wall biosynthesis
MLSTATEGNLMLKRLLYLGFAFPPGVQALHRGLNPAGHGLETQMVGELRDHFEIRSVGVLPIEPPSLPDADPATGIAHDLLLLDKPPELLHRYQSLVRLKRQYNSWRANGWLPDAVLVYNLSPIYNNFLRWLKRQSPRPRLILLLLDSPQLGQRMSAAKRFRHRFKPMVIPDEKMIAEFDGCIGLSRSADRFFAPRNVPFLWMPGGVTPRRSALVGKDSSNLRDDEPVRFAYFGILAAHSGIEPLVETFRQSSVDGSLHICGFGRLASEIASIAARDPRLKFHGCLSPDECLAASENWDVLINPRPASHGNENNFPSKVFEYALCGRAILTSRLAGVDDVLGPEAFYFDAQHYNAELGEQLSFLSRTSRSELRRRGMILRERITSQYSWERQAGAMAEFISARVSNDSARSGG